MISTNNKNTESSKQLCMVKSHACTHAMMYVCSCMIYMFVPLCFHFYSEQNKTIIQFVIVWTYVIINSEH